MLGQRRRRRPRFEPEQGQRPMFAWEPSRVRCGAVVVKFWRYLANTRTNVGLMLVHRLRSWINIKPALVKRLVFSENAGAAFTRSRRIYLYRNHINRGEWFSLISHTCKGKGQYLLTLQVSRYSLLPLQSSIDSQALSMQFYKLYFLVMRRLNHENVIEK